MKTFILLICVIISGFVTDNNIASNNLLYDMMHNNEKDQYKDFFASSANGSYRKGRVRLVTIDNQTSLVEIGEWEQITYLNKNNPISCVRTLTTYDSLGNIKKQSIERYLEKDKIYITIEDTELKKENNIYCNVASLYNIDGNFCGEIWYELLDFEIPKPNDIKQKLYDFNKTKYYDDAYNEVAYKEIKKKLFIWYQPPLKAINQDTRIK